MLGRSVAGRGCIVSGGEDMVVVVVGIDVGIVVDIVVVG